MIDQNYSYKTPVPKIFFRNGALDPTQKNYRKRLAFLTWAYGMCFYGALKFSCSRRKAAIQSGLTFKEWRTQEKYFIRMGFLMKAPNQPRGKASSYEWNRDLLLYKKGPKESKSQVGDNHKIIDMDNHKKGPSDDENYEKRAQEKAQKIPVILREENEGIRGKMHEKRAQEPPPFKEQIKQITTCSKETSKEKFESEKSHDLSLFLDEKNNTSSFEQIEINDQQLALEGLINMRGLDTVSPKTIWRWQKKFPYEEIVDTIYLCLSPSQEKVKNPGGWIEKALQQGWAKKEKVKKQNLEFAKDLKKKNNLNNLIINSRYCFDVKTQKDYYFHISQEEFQRQLVNCL